MKTKKLKKVLLLILAAAVLILAVSCVVVPYFQKRVTLSGGVPHPADLGSANERVLSVDDNTQALLWRLRVIEEAREELVFTTYSFKDDESGRDIMAALHHASERGVKVRMVVDGITSLLDLQKSQCFQALSAAENVEIRVYNPVNLLTPWRLNYRMHDKYLVADDTVYILGGRNTKNLSLGNYQEKQDRDRDVVVYAPRQDSRNSVTQVRDYFERIWALPTTEAFPTSGRNHEKGWKTLHERYETLGQMYPEAFRETDWEGATMATKGVQLLTNPIEAENKAPVLWSSLISLMNAGEESIVQTPYLICNRKMYEDLTDLWREGKKTEIILNSVETGANVFGGTDYLNEKREIRNTGTHIYEYTGAHSSHTKTVLIDRDISIVGSFNFDMRSAYLDTEMMLVIKSPELNDQLRGIAETQKNESRHLLPDGSVSFGTGYQHRNLPLPKYVVYGMLRVIIRPFRHLV